MVIAVRRARIEIHRIACVERDILPVEVDDELPIDHIDQLRALMLQLCARS